ncbi:YciI family protein [Massilia sp. GCM10020059]|uniref:YciI family protein n=1 Tax=Massilia agrisoli TaxID=2892444 RepID=A0ABS8IT87_9BURK|nr:YciI family protein [Massilia agrisoli]MCC6070444.1 YciI family protein [Massilia agrisoli]
MHRSKQVLAAALAAFLIAPAALAETPAAARPQQFVYMLRVAPHLHDAAKWSDKDKAATSRHFERLKKATADGKVILAGRTTEQMDKTFGLVVFEADDEKAARAFMEADPAVVAGVMTATLHPYSVALQRK